MELSDIYVFIAMLFHYTSLSFMTFLSKLIIHVLPAPQSEQL